MRLSCPNCQTEYNVPDAALVGRTRTLRCVSCGTQWQAGPLDPELAAANVAPTLNEAPRSPVGGRAETPQIPPAPSYQATTRYTPQSNTASLGERPSRQPIDPAEARSIADRESFAALLESSRQQAGAQIHDDTPARSSTRKLNPLLVSILLLLLIIALAVLERHPIMAAWPASIRLFGALGLK